MDHIMILQTGWKIKRPWLTQKNEDNECFKYAATVALNYKETESHQKRVSYIEPFINKYNWEGIKYPSKRLENVWEK